MLRSVLRRLSALGPKLDLYPVLPMVRLSGPGKSYHFGSTFPHGNGSDLLGRIGQFRNIHLIDGSVLPSVPSTTFTLHGDGERPPHRVGEPTCLTGRAVAITGANGYVGITLRAAFARRRLPRHRAAAVGACAR